MCNYGEELGYWYLRLNGFFPLTDFVIHPGEDGNKYPADADLLAVRPPDVYEELGGNRLECDCKILAQSEASSFVVVFCEVKTGEYNISQLFPRERVSYVEKRCGVVQGTTIFKKALIANKKKRNIPNDVVYISLKDVITYIRDRFKQYDEHKYPSRMFFNSSLIQLMIHEAKNEG